MTSDSTPADKVQTAEHRRLAEADAGQVRWRRWGPYLAERQWGTVREDYSANGDAWNYFPHDHARSRVYRWGEDGIAGVSEVAGLKGNLTLDLSPGFGYGGIVVAMLAQLHPIGVIGTAVFVAAVFVGADAMSRGVGVPNYIADVIVATALLCMLVALLLTRYRLRQG